MTPWDDLEAVIGLARGDEDGAPCSEAVRSALQEAMARRCGPDAPSPPTVGPLTVRRLGLPDWWGRDNLLLAGPDVEPGLAGGLVNGARSGNVGVVGAGASVGNLVFPSQGGLIVIGDGVQMLLGEFTAMNGGTVLIGEDCTGPSWARVDARNGGAVLVGADGMWAERVDLLTDDMHAIRDLESGRRTNRYGGRIVVQRHVWLCERVRMTGGAQVGENTVVGLDAFVRGSLPAGSVCVGSPARPIRQGVTWTREDLP